MQNNIFIAYCGLDCNKCEAHKATVNNDQILKEIVAKKWSKLNQVTITPDMINCDGCRLDGNKTPFCDHLCQVKICAESKNFTSCRERTDKYDCEKLKPFLNNKDAYNNIFK